MSNDTGFKKKRNQLCLSRGAVCSATSDPRARVRGKVHWNLVEQWSFLDVPYFISVKKTGPRLRKKLLIHIHKCRRGVFSIFILQTALAFFPKSSNCFFNLLCSTVFPSFRFPSLNLKWSLKRKVNFWPTEVVYF